MEMMAGRLQLMKVRAEEMGLQASVPASGTELRKELFEMEQFIALNAALNRAMKQWNMKYRVAAIMEKGKVRVRAQLPNEYVDFVEELQGFPGEDLMAKLQMINPENG
jgi:predicted nucleotidyltransferase